MSIIKAYFNQGLIGEGDDGRDFGVEITQVDIESGVTEYEFYTTEEEAEKRAKEINNLNTSNWYNIGENVDASAIVEEMVKSDFKDQNIITLAKEKSVSENILREKLSFFDMTVCDDCHAICFTPSEVRYALHDFVYKNEALNIKDKDGYCVCDDCLNEEEIEFI